MRELYRRADVNPEIKPGDVTVEEVGRLCNAYASVSYFTELIMPSFSRTIFKTSGFLP